MAHHRKDQNMTAASCGLAKLSGGSCFSPKGDLGKDYSRAAFIVTPMRYPLCRQVVNENATEQFLNMRRRDQQRALGRLREDAGLR